MNVDRINALALLVGLDTGDMKSRLKFQKLAYIVQEILGFDLGLEFSKFFYGPYSPELSSLLDDLPRNGPSAEEVAPVAEVALSLWGESDRVLELLSTYHSFLVYTGDPAEAERGLREVRVVDDAALKRVLELYGSLRRERT